MPACQRALRINVLACQRGLRANVPYEVPMLQFGLPTCQTACQFLKHFILRSAKGNLYALLLVKQFYILLDIPVIHIICICIVHKNCIILHFYTSYHIKQKCVEFCFLLFFFCFCSLARFSIRYK